MNGCNMKHTRDWPSQKALPQRPVLWRQLRILGPEQLRQQSHDSQTLLAIVALGCRCRGRTERMEGSERKRENNLVESSRAKKKCYKVSKAVFLHMGSIDLWRVCWMTEALVVPVNDTVRRAHALVKQLISPHIATPPKWRLSRNLPPRLMITSSHWSALSTTLKSTQLHVDFGESYLDTDPWSKLEIGLGLWMEYEVWDNL